MFTDTFFSIQNLIISLQIVVNVNKLILVLYSDVQFFRNFKNFKQLICILLYAVSLNKRN